MELCFGYLKYLGLNIKSDDEIDVGDIITFVNENPDVKNLLNERTGGYVVDHIYDAFRVMVFLRNMRNVLLDDNKLGVSITGNNVKSLFVELSLATALMTMINNRTK